MEVSKRECERTTTRHYAVHHHAFLCWRGKRRGVEKYSGGNQTQCIRSLSTLAVAAAVVVVLVLNVVAASSVECSAEGHRPRILLVDEVEGFPINGATAWLGPACDACVTTTDSSGLLFLEEALTDARGPLVIRHDGYLDALLDTASLRDHEREPLVMRPCGATSLLEIRCLDDRGSPICQARLEVSTPGETSTEARSDASGGVRIRVRAGERCVVPFAEGHCVSSSSGPLRPPEGNMPGLSYILAASERYEVTFVLERLATIRVRISNHLESRVDYFVSYADMSFRFDARVDEDGWFTAQVFPEPGRIWVRSGDRISGEKGFSLDPGASCELDLVLEPAD